VNTNIREYWQLVNRVESQLPETVYITSQVTKTGDDLLDLDIELPARSKGNGHVAGRVFHVSRQAAALLLVARSHRRSTPEEVQQWAAEQEQRKAAIAAALYESKNQYALPPELTKLVEAATKDRSQSPEVIERLTTAIETLAQQRVTDPEPQRNKR
jgi:cation transport regulator ChaC